MSASQRRKGKAYEQDVARRLREAFPEYDVRRGWQADGREAPDVSAGPFAVECKHKRALSVPAAMRDAISHAPKGMHPVLFAKWHRDLEVVAMPAEDWLELAVAAQRWWER